MTTLPRRAERKGGGARQPLLLLPGNATAPDWAEATGAHAVPPEALDDAGGAELLERSGCVLVDATLPRFVGLARRVHALDPGVQIVAVTPQERLQAARRALLYAPGLGEVWVVSPAEATPALTERAAGVTRQRRRSARTRARLPRATSATSPRHAERALISDAYLAGLLRALPDPVFSVDAAGNVLSANAAAEQTFGAHASVLGLGFGQVLGLEQADPQALLERAARDGQVAVEFRGAGGERRLGEIRAAAMDGAAAGAWAVVLRDVTEQRATYERERIARMRVERLQALTAALAATRTLDEVAGVVVAQTVEATGAGTGVLVLRPPGADALTMVLQAGLPEDVVHRHGTIPLTAPVPAAECIRTGKALFIETRNGPEGLFARFPGSRDVWAALGTAAAASVPLDVGGEVIGAMSFTFHEERGFDAREREFFRSLARQAAQAVERARLLAAERTARQQADEANRAKSQFLATMSHELRTPLNAISGHVSLVLDEIYGPITAEQRSALRRALRAEAHLLALINDVLTFARLESARMAYDLEALDASEVLTSVFPLVEPQVAGKGLSLDVRLPGRDGEPPLRVLADRDKVAQILVNLLSNAIKFTDPGGRIEVHASKSVHGGGAAAALTISDTGIGIPEEKLDSIFAPFVQVHLDVRRSREGTGLGLAISRDLARGMGGDLVAESRPGRGSAFTLLIPLAG